MDWEKVYEGRFLAYRDFIIKNGGDKELFNNPYIKELIMSVIVDGDARVIFEGRSPIYYKDPNEDGTFDICGRTNGPTVDVYYKVCRQLNMLIITRYEPVYKTEDLLFNIKELYPSSISRQTTVIDDKDGSIITEDRVHYIPIEHFSSLMQSLQKNGIIEKLT